MSDILQAVENAKFPIIHLFFQKHEKIPSVITFAVENFDDNFILQNDEFKIIAVGSQGKNCLNYSETISDPAFSGLRPSYQNIYSSHFIACSYGDMLVFVQKSHHKENPTINIYYRYSQKEEANRLYDFIYSNFPISEQKVETKIALLINSPMGGFDKFTITLPDQNLDIQANYNDGFDKFDYAVKQFINSTNSGLVLMHGEPGTGKSSYIKYLSKQTDNDVIFIPSNIASSITDPSFIEFLIHNKNAILILEDAERILESRDVNSYNNAISSILNITDGLVGSALRIKIIATFNCEIDKIDKALRRKGRLVAEYKFEELEANKVDNLLKMAKLEPRGKRMSLAEVYNIANDNVFYEEKTESSRKIGFL